MRDHAHAGAQLGYKVNATGPVAPTTAIFIDCSSPGTARSRSYSGGCRTGTAGAHFARQFFECSDPILSRRMGRE
jgi:hypothetical protein